MIDFKVIVISTQSTTWLNLAVQMENIYKINIMLHCTNR